MDILVNDALKPTQDPKTSQCTVQSLLEVKIKESSGKTVSPHST